MDVLPALPVVVPILVAAGMAAVGHWLPRRVVEMAAVLTAAAATGICSILLVHSAGHLTIYWFSGWHPSHAIALGIDLAIDPIGAGAAMLAGVLMTAALMFSPAFFTETAEHRYDVLMLMFLGAMVGFALTGDLFDLFVFFELMSVSAYALTGFEIERPGPLQGALNFGIVNSLGSFSVLLGIALVYARTGALNLAQIGEALSRHSTDGLVVVSFSMIAVGLLVKASVVPFHFWLPDAHAVAPATVCVLFSGVMVELGLYGVGRVYWTAFSGAFAPHAHDVGHVLLGFGVVTALVGAFFCFVQQHLKRLLAFSTVSHVGLFLIGIALLDHDALAGSAIYVAAHGLVKGGLFLAAGIVTYRLSDIDEEDLRGRGRSMVGTAVLFAAGGLAIAEVPPFGTFTGKTLIEDAASKAGLHWVPWVFGIAAAASGGAILRAAARIFGGLGPEEPSRFASERSGEDHESEEEEHGHDKTPALLIVPAALLVAGGLAIGLVPGLSGRVERASHGFEDRPAYASAVLTGRVEERAVPAEPPSALGVWYGLASGAGAVALAGVALFRRRLMPRRLREGAAAWFGPPVRGVRGLQSGHAGDYAAWFTVGAAALGGALALAVR